MIAAPMPTMLVENAIFNPVSKFWMLASIFATLKSRSPRKIPKKVPRTPIVVNSAAAVRVYPVNRSERVIDWYRRAAIAKLKRTRIVKEKPRAISLLRTAS